MFWVSIHYFYNSVEILNFRMKELSVYLLDNIFKVFKIFFGSSFANYCFLKVLFLYYFPVFNVAALPFLVYIHMSHVPLHLFSFIFFLRIYHDIYDDSY